MCDRYVLATDPQQMMARFALDAIPPRIPAYYNVAPQMYWPVIVAHAPCHLDVMRWGLVPSWAKDERVGQKTHNARAETAAESPAFRAALRYHRCLVPASGYYEWRGTPRARQPYYVHLRDEPLFAFAGLYDIWYSPDGSELRTYTILTCAPNALLAPIRNRMPVILARDAQAAWLDPRETRTTAVLPLLQPYPAEAMAAYPVSAAVDTPTSDGPALIAPLSPVG